VSVTAAVINFVNIHTAAGEVEIRRKGKYAARAVELQCCWFLRGIRIVCCEQDFLIGLSCVEQDHGMVDLQARKADEVNDRRAVLPDFSGQLLRGAFLVTSAERPDHAPVSTLKITLPRSAAFLFQEILLRHAELAQVRIAGNNDFFIIRHFFTRTARNNLVDELAIGLFVSGGLRWIEAGVDEELFRRAGDDKAMVRVIRLRLARSMDPFALRVEVVFPDQLVRVGESVVLKIEVVSARSPYRP